MTLPKLAPVKEYETAQLDFCSNPKIMLESNCGGKNATTCQFVYRTRGQAYLFATMEAPGPAGHLDVRPTSGKQVATMVTIGW